MEPKEELAIVWDLVWQLNGLVAGTEYEKTAFEDIERTRTQVGKFGSDDIVKNVEAHIHWLAARQQILEAAAEVIVRQEELGVYADRHMQKRVDALEAAVRAVIRGDG